MQAFRTWPRERPLAALVTAVPHPKWGRTSVLAEPQETCVIPWLADASNRAEDCLAALEATLAQHPDSGMWLVALAYEWGGLLERTAMPARRAPADAWPLAVLCWCPNSHVYSHERGEWLTEPPPGVSEGNTNAHSDRALAEISHLEADAPRADFEHAVKRTVEYIRAGDIFQANIAQRFSAQWRGCRRTIAAAAFEAAAPRYGAYIETATHALASMSPELFLQSDPCGRIVTRPVKGTRGENEGATALAASEKDAAELHMIVDLMRNDLGRVCKTGTVRVDDPRSIESHATVHHGVAEVSGQLRADATFTDVLRATFPPGSVTGAPKVRAMQVIDELEPCSRGPYCGAVGSIAADGITLNVGIRTICMHRNSAEANGGTLRYSAGCGIVADSDPAKEYEESLHKTAVMLHTAHALRPKSR